jgi:hypothetical protein
LYLVDGNGHLMKNLLDSSRKPVSFSASITFKGNHFAAHQGYNKAANLQAQGLEAIGEGEDENSEDESVFASNYEQTRFQSNIGPIASDEGVVWEITGPPGILEQPTLTKGELVAVTSPTFKMEVPKVLQLAAKNLSAQAEALAQTMGDVSGRTRRRGPTAIGTNPTSGAVAAHDGSVFGIGAGIFYRDQPTLVHTFVHELAHNFNFHHGGMMESVIEVCRCTGGEQISQQPAKWLFLDLMNGLKRKKTGYPNIGLYLYCYAQRGPYFLHFVSVNEPVILEKLLKENYTVDEVTDAVCTLAMDRDMTPICRNWGLTLAPDRVAQVLREARACVVNLAAPSYGNVLDGH